MHATLRCHKTPISGKRLAAFRDEYNADIVTHVDHQSLFGHLVKRKSVRGYSKRERLSWTQVKDVVFYVISGSIFHITPHISEDLGCGDRVIGDIMEKGKSSPQKSRPINRKS